ncbi:MAG: SEC-C metal-binding domain-containing protein [Aureliella sp.]
MCQLNCSRSVPERTRLCEGRRPGSIPGGSTFSTSTLDTRKGADQCDTNTSTTKTTAFEPMSKRRRGFPSEKHVKCGVRIVRGDKQLEEKLGRNDPCPCGSGQRFKRCCLKSGHF